MNNELIATDILNRVYAKRKRPLALRMIPMIDMIFLLLIFFLVAGKWRPAENFLPVQLPTVQAQGLNLTKPEPLLIQISPTQTGCRISIGQLETAEIENQTIEAGLSILLEKLRACMLTQKRFAGDPVEIICHPQVKWEYMAKIYNTLYALWCGPDRYHLRNDRTAKRKIKN